MFMGGFHRMPNLFCITYIIRALDLFVIIIFFPVDDVTLLHYDNIHILVVAIELLFCEIYV